MSETVYVHDPQHVAALAGAIERLEMTNDRLTRAIADINPAAWPFRDSAVKADLRVVSSGPVKVTYAHATNELAGSNDAYLQFFDEFNPDAVKLGQTKPDFTLWLPAGGGLADPWVPPAGFRRGLVIAATSTRDGAAAPAQLVLVDLLCVPLREVER